MSLVEELAILADHGRAQGMDEGAHWIEQRALADAERLYRCTVCGKWSHAKRKPATHKRFIVNPDEPVELPGTTRTAETAAEIAADAELRVSDTIEPSWNGDPEQEEDPGGVWVLCGPFETYLAIKEHDGD